MLIKVKGETVIQILLLSDCKCGLTCFCVTARECQIITSILTPHHRHRPLPVEKRPPQLLIALFKRVQKNNEMSSLQNNRSRRVSTSKQSTTTFSGINLFPKS